MTTLPAALALVEGGDSWPPASCAGTVDGSGLATMAGPASRPFRWASVTKILTALAVWIAVEEGTVAWEDPVGPPGSTLAHLLAHASGLSPDSDGVLAPPGRRRIYSNRGFEVAASHVGARAEMPFVDYLTAGVLEPLDLESTVLVGSPASGAAGTLEDLLKVGRELLAPTLVSTDTLGRGTTVAFPGLDGVLPGFGQQRPNDWGLGVELRDHKSPHWTGRDNSPGTFGHFGQSGSFLWVDSSRRLALASLSPAAFGSWATTAWPQLSDAVLAASEDH